MCRMFLRPFGVAFVVFSCVWVPAAGAEEPPEGWLRSGQEAAARGDHGRAVSAFSEALRKDPESAAAREGRAAALLATGRVGTALTDCDEAVKSRPDRTSAWLLRAEARARRSLAWGSAAQADAAMDDCAEALRLGGARAGALAMRGLAHAAKRDFRQALADCDEAVKAEPRLAAARLARARVYGLMQQDEKALADYAEALRLTPECPAVAVLRGGLFLARGELEQARAEARRAAKVAPGNVDVCLFLARLYHEEGDIPRAREALAPALKGGPVEGEVRLVRGRLRLENGEVEAALADCDEAVRSEPGNAEALAVRALSLAQQGDFDRAVADLDAAVKLHPRNADLRALRGLVLAAKGEGGRGLADCQEALRLGPAGADLYVARAGVLASRKRWDDAASDLEAALKLRPGHREARMELGVLRRRQGKPNLAVEELTRSVMAAPRDPAPLVHRALAHVDRGDHQQAQADFEAATKLDADRAVRERGEALLKDGDPSKALPDLEAAVRSRPKDALLRLVCAEAYLGVRRGAKALAECDAAVRLAPGSSLAYVQRAACRPPREGAKGALADLDQALKIDPRSVLALAARAGVHLDQRETTKAQADCEAALGIDPDDPQSLLVLAAVALGSLGAKDKRPEVAPTLRLESQAPPPAPLGEGRGGAPAPDLSALKPVIDDTFADPKTSVMASAAAREPQRFRFEDGKFVVAEGREGAWWAGWGSGSRSRCLACLLQGRVKGAGEDAWGVMLVTDADKRALVVRVRADGRVEIGPFSGSDPTLRLPPPRVVGIDWVKKGEEFNDLLVVVRRRLLEVYLNGKAVGEPIALPQDLTPGSTVVTLLQKGPKPTRAEFKRYAVWHLPDPFADDPSAGDGHLRGQPVGCVALSPDGRLGLSGGGAHDPCVCVWDLRAGKQRHRLAGHTQGVEQAVLLPGGREALTRDAGGEVRLWDVDGGRLLRKYDRAWGRCLALADDGSHALTVGAANVIDVWEVPRGEKDLPRRVSRYVGYPHPPAWGALLGGGKKVLCAGGDPKVPFRVWDGKSGAELKSYADYGKFVYKTKLAFTADGEMAVVAGVDSGQDNAMRLWGVGADREAHRFRGNGVSALSLAVSPSGETAASGGADGAVRVWGLKEGDLRHVLAGTRSGARCLAVAAGGRAVICGDESGAVLLWRLPLAADQAIDLCSRALKANPGLAAALVLRGQLHNQRGQAERALEDFEAAIRTDQRHADGYFQRGLTYAEKLDYDRALKDLSRAVELEPEHPRALYVRGLVYTEKGDLRRAKIDLDRAFKLGSSADLVQVDRMRGN